MGSSRLLALAAALAACSSSSATEQFVVNEDVVLCGTFSALATLPEALDQKVAALSAMRTQTAPAIAVLGLETYAALNAQEWFVEAPARC